MNYAQVVKGEGLRTRRIYLFIFIFNSSVYFLRNKKTNKNNENHLEELRRTAVGLPCRYLRWSLDCFVMQSYSLQYCCYVWTGAPSRYLEMFDKPQKQACRIAESSLTLHSLVPHRRNVAGLNFFFSRYYFRRCSSELSACFLSPFLDVIRMSMSTVSFLSSHG